MLKFISSKSKGKPLLLLEIHPTPHHRKQSHKGAEDSIVDKTACHQHATLPKLNSPTVSPRNHDK